MSLENLKPIAEAIGAIDTEIKALTKKKKELEAEIRPTLADRGPTTFGEYQFEVKTVPGRKTLDKTLLEEAGISIDRFMKVGKPYTTMSIKKVVVV